MPDQKFANPRLVAIYDHFDGPRRDLDHYVSIINELEAKSVVDVGCGTGSFACMLSELGYLVTALDPAAASLDVAKTKPGADKVRWILGDATCLPSIEADLVVMTGNVAQVFLTDESWNESLKSIRQALRKHGHLVFEVRNPARRDWKNWTKENTYKCLNIGNIGFVESWCDITNVSDEFVSFRWTYVFASDGKVLTSDSTLRFRERNAIEDSLTKNGFLVESVREAPDRPGKEFVFICSIS
jgi:SAM-dependent methyltransferase